MTRCPLARVSAYYRISAMLHSMTLGVICFTLASGILLAQTNMSGPNPGLYPFATVSPTDFDTINVANLNIMLQVPVHNKAGVADLPFTFALNGNSAISKYDNGHGSIFWSTNFGL